MITYKTGNLLEASTEALVNTVNTIGVMGKGIALQFKKTFPHNFKVYQQAVKEGRIRTGSVLVVPVSQVNGVRFIINFPTKEHWRSPSTLAYIESGLRDLVQVLQDYDIHSVALPPLGCGNGGLSWQDVKPLIEKALADVPTDVLVYEPNEAVKILLAQQVIKKEVKLTPARAMMLHLLLQYRQLGEFATEFAAQKLGYFLQRFGDNQLKLRFKKHHYGPYSNEIRHLLYSLNGVFIRGFEQKDLKPFEPFELIPDRVEEVVNYVERNLSEQDRFRLMQVAKLIDGYESPWGLELLATVDVLAQEHEALQPGDVAQYLSQWSSRKYRLFNEYQTEQALKQLRLFPVLLEEVNKSKTTGDQIAH